MYYFTHSNENLAWFEVKGRSLYEVLNLVEENKLSLNNIEIIGKSLYVSLYKDHFKFVEGLSYYLSLINENNYCKIDRVYDEFTPVPEHLRKEIKDVSDDTWHQLFKSKTRLYDCPSKEEEYKDEYFEHLEYEDSEPEPEEYKELQESDTLYSEIEFSDYSDDFDYDSYYSDY